MKPVTTKILREELKELRDELKITFKENNNFIFKHVDKAFKQNNQILFKRIDKTVHNRLSEASDAILHTIDTNRDEANQKFEEVIKKVDKLSTDVKFMHQDLKDIVTDMSDKPSRKQFETFKSQFDNYPTL